MSEPTVIRVRSLGKRYLLGTHTGVGSLRDAISDGARSVLRRRRSRAEILWALKDVTFEVSRGEVVGIIGRNGAGKSTLLKILSRITVPTTGSAELWGQVSSLLEVGTGFHPELTGRENIYLNGAILGMPRRQIEDQFSRIVAFAEIDRFLDTPVKRYSSGMYVRLAFAVAAHLDFDILLVDEVLAVGDVGFQRKCLGRMDEVAQRGRTVVFVSHNLGVIGSLCSRCLTLSAGSIVDDGAPADVLARYLERDSNRARVDLTEWTAERTGTGPMRVREVTSCGEDGKHRSTFGFDEPIAFLIRVEGTSGSCCLLAVSLRDRLGNLIIHLNNSDDHFEIELPNEDTWVRVTLPRNFLNNGDYYVTVWLGDELNVLHDRVGNCLRMTVDDRMRGGVRSLAPVRASAGWEVLLPSHVPGTTASPESQGTA